MRVDGVSVKSSLTHPLLIIKRYQGGAKVRSYVQLTNMSPDMGLGIFNGDINTVATALLERMYYCKVGGVFMAPPPVRGGALKNLKKFRNRVVRNVRVPSVLTLQEVVDKYTGRKHTIYSNTLSDLQQTPLRRQDGYSIAFVKVEKGKPTKAPRGIQPRTTRYNLVLGKYIKACEEKIYQAIAKVFGDGPTVMKGYNIQQVGRIIAGKWNSFKDPVAVGLDAVKFDMHVSAEMLEYEHGFYKMLFPKSDELSTILTWQINNRGFAYAKDGRLSYTVKGRRFSGDMNTALGNCIIMCSLIWTLAKERGINVKLVNNGDDCVVFMEREDLSKFTHGLNSWFLQYGFRMTVEVPCYELEHIEFCQMHPVSTPNGVTMVRNVHTALAKDTMTVLPIRNGKAASTWLKAIGEAGMALTPGIPVVQSFYAFCNRQAQSSGKLHNAVAMQTGMKLLSRGLEPKWEDVHPDTRYSFFKAFDITPDEQTAYEECFSKFKVDYTAIEPSDRTAIPYYSITKHDI